ncbi:MAG: hypothetical protein BroJett021_22720 [Chloroflexota bacterium]|nr:hypothetical protein [Caldilinea sp.]GIK73284.1 MAG: hypothetical protein BroJett021_22720 [Chloroflexota bacterium]
MALEMSFQWPAERVMSDQFLTVSARLAVGEARAQLAIGQPLVIVGEDGFPVGVLPEEALGLLADADARLEDVSSQWLLPTVTRPDAPLALLWAGMLDDPTARWHVVWDGRPVGVIDPATLFRLLREQQNQQPVDFLPPQVRQLLDLLSNLPRLVAAADMLPGDPIVAPDTRCFRCTGGDALHYVCRGREVRANPHAAPTCPDHPGQRLVALTPCPGSCT